MASETQPATGSPARARPGPVALRPYAAVAIATLGLVALTESLAALADLNYVLSLAGILDASASLDDFRQARDQVQAFEVASTVVIALAAIAFLTWFALAYRNLERLGTTELRFRRGWAVGGWLVPVVNLALPKLIADDLWRASAPGLDRTGRGWRSLPVSNLVHSWWLLLLTAAAAASVATVANDFGNRGVLSTPQDFEQERLAFAIYAIAELAAAVAAVAAIRVVLALTRRQQAAIAAADSTPAPGPAAAADPAAPAAASAGPSPWAPGSGGRDLGR